MASAFRLPDVSPRPRRSSGEISFTLDLEERTPAGAESRIDVVMDKLLEFFANREIRATVFIVGTLLAERPRLASRVAAGGHEMGLHGFDHRRLAAWDWTDFVARCRDARNQLQDLTDQAVLGFRAPFFSVTPEVPWAPDAIAEAGFVYSSSVHPARHPNTGYPGAPRVPFTWPCGLIELPCPVRFGIPVGGAYLRLLPAFACDLLVRSIRETPPWLYAHPYDFDAGELFARIPETSWLESRLLFARRKVMFSRIEHALRRGQGPVLGDWVSHLARDSLPNFA
jgi:peptidoglycan-N-acetylglucosamine deacetylase